MTHPVRRGPSLLAAVGIHNILMGNNGLLMPDLLADVGFILSELLISEKDDPGFKTILEDPREYNCIKDFYPISLEATEAKGNYYDSDGNLRLKNREFYLRINLKGSGSITPEGVEKGMEKVAEYLVLNKKMLPRSFLVGVTPFARLAKASEELWPVIPLLGDGRGLFAKSSKGDSLYFQSCDEIVKIFSGSKQPETA
ncbi:MAG: hypothetical protein HW400_26 [Candidatus Levybacteria bacterium]|nr:hypothetical protein [Candidatus Levybacteria bacterium]